MTVRELFERWLSDSSYSTATVARHRETLAWVLDEIGEVEVASLGRDHFVALVDRVERSERSERGEQSLDLLRRILRNSKTRGVIDTNPARGCWQWFHVGERLIGPEWLAGGREKPIVDLRMVPLVTRLWALGIGTFGCCQGNPYPVDGRGRGYRQDAYIAFGGEGPSGFSAELFTLAVYTATADNDLAALRAWFRDSVHDPSFLAARMAGYIGSPWRFRCHPASYAGADLLRVHVDFPAAEIDELTELLTKVSGEGLAEAAEWWWFR